MRARSACLLFAVSLGCAATTAAPSVATDAPTATDGPATPNAESATLVSVRPGVNDAYTQPGAIETWTDKLEGERREVIAERDVIVAAMQLRPGMVVADIGAGTGAFMQALSVAVGEHGVVYAVDIIPQFLVHLRERAGAEQLANVTVVDGTPTATNLPADSVDVLFVCDVYHHFEYPSVYLRSLHEALKPDGQLIIVEFDKVPGKTSAGMMKHVRQDKPTLLAEVTAEGFVLDRELDVGLDENYMLVFRKSATETSN